MLLSCPATFKRLENNDDLYAEANSCRQDFISKSALITHSARQIVCNIWGFKMRKGPSMSALKIAEFWLEHIRVAPSQNFMTKKSTVDTRLTLHSRLFSIPECEKIVVAADRKYGAESVWNSLWKLQEIIYRCQKKSRIVWTMAALEDMLESQKVNAKDVTISSLKSGSRSLTDVALTQLALKDHLLGPWLDARNFPPFVKEKVRAIFIDHKAYRESYNPLNNACVDTTFLFGWPKVGRDLIQFLDSLIYSSTPQEESMFRLAVKNSNTPAEILSWKPFCETIAGLQTDINRTACMSHVSVVSAVHNTNHANAREVAECDDVEDMSGEPDDTLLDKALEAAADRMERHMTLICVEPQSQTALAELLQASPLGTVLATKDSGNVMILVDCNTYGETDVQPALRACPMGSKIFQQWFRAVLQARHGSDEPDQLHIGDIFYASHLEKIVNVCSQSRSLSKGVARIRTEHLYGP